MAGTGVPGAATHVYILNLFEVEATPIALWRQAGVASASKLVGQRHFAIVGVSKNVRAEFAVTALIDVRDLLALENRASEESVRSACHRPIAVDLPIATGTRLGRHPSAPRRCRRRAG